MWRAVFVSLGILALDIVSKFFTQAYIPYYSSFSQYPYGGIGIFQDFFGLQFSLNYTTNTGAAWSLFASYTQVLLIARLVLVGWLMRTFWNLPKHSAFFLPLALIIAGALGNVLDMFVYGHVIDMFHWVLWGYDYPVFNVADCAICIGVGLYCLRAFTAASHASTRQS